MQVSDCSDEIPILSECQIRASSFRDDLSVPFNSLSNTSGKILKT